MQHLGDPASDRRRADVPDSPAPEGTTLRLRLLGGASSVPLHHANQAVGGAGGTTTSRGSGTDRLCTTIGQRQNEITIPPPSLALLVGAGEGASEYLEELRNGSTEPRSEGPALREEQAF